MRNITAAVGAIAPVQKDTELIWDEVRSNVVLFSDGEPLSIVSLESNENREDTAIQHGLNMLQGMGITL